jgi:hypothetical protein
MTRIASFDTCAESDLFRREFWLLAVLENGLNPVKAIILSAKDVAYFEGREDKFLILNKILIQKSHSPVYNRDEDNHGRRYATHMQRLWTGFYVHRCRSAVFPRTRLFDPQALQALPSGKKERTRWGRLRLSSGSIPRHTCDLFRLRPANDCSI